MKNKINIAVEDLVIKILCTWFADSSQDVQIVLDAKEKYWQKVDEILREKNIKDAKSIILDLIQMLRTVSN